MDLLLGVECARCVLPFLCASSGGFVAVEQVEEVEDFGDASTSIPWAEYRLEEEIKLRHSKERQLGWWQVFGIVCALFMYASIHNSFEKWVILADYDDPKPHMIHTRWWGFQRTERPIRFRHDDDLEEDTWFYADKSGEAVFSNPLLDDSKSGEGYYP